MEENKKERKEENEEKVKIYDKEMYISSEKLKTISIIIIVFIIGFIAGYFSCNFVMQGNDKSINVENVSENTL